MLHLFDTYERKIRPFTPLKPPEAKLYACGQTVYDYAHIGNLRSYLFEDILRRVLEFNGYQVTHVMNITDVGHLTDDADSGEDKMEVGTRRAGKSAWELAEIFTESLKGDLALLNIQEPHVWCKATDHIAEQVEMIQCIEAKGYTYRTGDGIYFDTAKLDDYGYLARLNIAGLQAGSRVAMSEKRNITDFALWKFSPPDQQRQMEWDSPWGIGFPGWHIECSAMATKYLGPFFDIHCGGEDHIMVHHPNEIAQSQACHGTRLANFWMHGYFLLLEGLKMSKSAGDFLRLQTIIDKGYDPLVYRYICLSGHYRAKITFNWQGMDGAAAALQRLRTAVFSWADPTEPDETALAQFTKEINDDLNMPRALAVTWNLVKSDLPDGVKKATILLFDQVLGLGLANWQPETAVSTEQIPDAVRTLLRQRQQARADKAWAQADALRDQIAAAGFEVVDTPDGPELKRSSGNA